MGLEIGEEILESNYDFEIEPQSYRRLDFEYYDEESDFVGLLLEYDIIVRDGPPIDVLLMTDDEFNYYDSGQRYRSLLDLSERDVISKEADGNIRPGAYSLVLNNGYNPQTNGDEDVFVSAEVYVSLLYRE